MLNDFRKIIISPIFTEKAMDAKEIENVFTFKVSTEANKIQIKQAIEKLFEVKVKSVRTVNVRGKMKREGRFLGKRADWKKAYVQLAEGQTIEAFNISG